ncbi:MAG: accessory gene regulator B family protein [Firmicutes bacterium]|nr:accessory gene regulator B family protein [Bacillota bacterium]
MIDLEGIAAKLANSLYGDSDMDEIEKAKIEYGFSLTIGLALTIVLALVPAAILGTFFSTLMLMMAALVTRLFSGGGHCTSYSRCLFLSLLIFIPSGILAKYLLAKGSHLLLAILCGFLMLTTLVVHFAKGTKAALPTATIYLVALAAGCLLRRSLLPQLLLPAGMGVFVQTIMVMRPGERVVEKADILLKRVIK